MLVTAVRRLAFLLVSLRSHSVFVFQTKNTKSLIRNALQNTSRRHRGTHIVIDFNFVKFYIGSIQCNFMFVFTGNMPSNGVLSSEYS